MADTLPAPYGDEMKGISQATGLPLGKIFCFIYNKRKFENFDSRRNRSLQYFLRSFISMYIRSSTRSER